ncbi:alpha/beta fold hydrolase [Quadrisphaera granulorum]|uniref:alpha/beta fold hydrolase n=1 Tax=Quadrisphaera granulorum TaxID=317664 RepID=UPI000D6BF055|nr:alpha/beta fold hydrolase [Quadrisphaera granulorum]
MPRVRIGDGDIAYDDDGNGLAVVLVHGGLGDRRMWDAQVPALAQHHRVIRYDWRGVGQPDSPADRVAHHEDVLGLMDALDIDVAVLIGASMGGAFALDAALTAPHRVSGLVLIGSALSGYAWPPAMAEHARERIAEAVPTERLRAYLSRTAVEVRGDDVAAMAEAQAELMVVGPGRRREDMDPAVWDSATRMLRDVFAREWHSPLVVERRLEPPAVGRLAEIVPPALVVNGLEDLPWIQSLADVLAAEIPGACRLDLEGTAHLPTVERPRELNGVLLDFLRRIR